MEAKSVLNTVTSINEQELPAAEKLILTSLIGDVGKMEERIAMIEKKVDGLERKVDTMQESISNLTKLIEASINQKQSTVKLFSDLIRNKWFWFWFIVFTIIIGGGSIADLANIVKIGG